MNINDFLKKSSIYNVLAVESLMSEDFRNKLSIFSKTIIVVLIFILLFFYFTKNSLRFTNFKNFIDQYSIIQRTIGLIILNIGIFLYSLLTHFYLSSTYYFKKIVKNKYIENELYTFSVGRILYSGRKTDILHGFIDSEIGKILFKKLNINKKDTKLFYNTQEINKSEQVPTKEDEILKVKDIANYLYFKNPKFSEFLSQNRVTDKIFFETIDLVVSEIEYKEFKKHWWRPEVLAGIKPLIK